MKADIFNVEIPILFLIIHVSLLFYLFQMSFWVITFMLEHKDILKRVQTEVDEALKDGRQSMYGSLIPI